MKSAAIRRESPLTPLVAAMETAVPGMVGEIGPARDDGYVRMGADNVAAVGGLVEAIAAAAPSAGPAYWAARSWGMLHWQPVLVAVVAVHRFAMAPPVDALAQRVAGAAVCGYRMPDVAVRAGGDALVAGAGRRLATLAEALLDDLQGLIRIKPVFARRLLADRLLATLALPEITSSIGPDMPNAAGRWLAATGLEGCSALDRVGCDDGIERYAVRRRACCLHFRVEPDVLCQGCPHRRSRKVGEADVRTV